MSEVTSSFDQQITHLHQVKAAMAPGLAIVTREIAESGNNPENTLRDIIKLARMLDIAAPAPHRSAGAFSDPRYNLLDYIKRSAGKMAVREINGDELLFDADKPFTCLSQIQEILEVVSDKLNRNFIHQLEYAV